MNQHHQHNLKIICNIKNNQGIYILDNKIYYDDRYFASWRGKFNMILFQKLYQESFNYYLILIFEKNTESTKSILDKLNNKEFMDNNYLFLEKSLEGLNRIENYYNLDSKDRIYELLKDKLENKKKINNVFITAFNLYNNPIINFFSNKNNEK